MRLCMFYSHLKEKDMKKKQRTWQSGKVREDGRKSRGSAVGSRKSTGPFSRKDWFSFSVCNLVSGGTLTDVWHIASFSLTRQHPTCTTLLSLLTPFHHRKPPNRTLTTLIDQDLLQSYFHPTSQDIIIQFVFSCQVSPFFH